MNRLNKTFLFFLVCSIAGSKGMEQLVENNLNSVSRKALLLYESRDYDKVEQGISLCRSPQQSPCDSDVPYAIIESKICRVNKKRPTIVRSNFEAQLLLERFLRAVRLNKLNGIDSPVGSMDELEFRKYYGPKGLHAAITSVSYNSVAQLLKHGVSPNVLNNRGECPLEVVRDNRIAQLLVDYGADVEQENDQGKTPIFSVLQDSCFGIARILLKAGANINKGDKNNDTLLHDAIKDLRAIDVKFLLYHGASVHISNNQRLTPYEMALQKGGLVLQAFEECIKVFSAINRVVEDKKCFTVMNLLAHNGRILKDLLRTDSSGYCSSDIGIAEKLLKQCDEEVWNELCCNCSSYSEDLLWLVKLIINRSDQRNDFVKALEENNFFMAKQFVKNNPYLLNTYEGEYEFDYANDLFADKFLSISALKPDYRHIKEMLSESFDFNLCDDQGQTLLCLLIMDEKDTIKYADLLKVGVSVNTPDNDGKTPLAYAVALGAQAKVEALLRYGAVVDGDMITDKYPNSFRTLLCEVFETQYCCVCEKHPESMSNIPCLKRHRGRFICKDCYESAHSQCPLCNRSMDQYGA